VKKKLRDKLYLYASQDLPMKLLSSIVECTPESSEGYFNDKTIQSNVQRFRKILKEVRFNMPYLSIDEWYLFALAYYQAGKDQVVPIIQTMVNATWIEYRNRFKVGSEFAEKVWRVFKESGGEIT